MAIELGDRKRREPRAACKVGQQSRFLCFGAGTQYGIGREYRGGEIRRAKQCATKLLCDDAKLHHAEPRAAVLLRYLDPGQRELLAQLAPHLGIVTVGGAHQAPDLNRRRLII